MNPPEKQAGIWSELFGVPSSTIRKMDMYKVYKAEYVEWRKASIADDFDPFTNDPNCKSCRKKKKGENDAGRLQDP